VRGRGKAYGKRFPTPGELRLMVYQCLGWGLKGVIYFAYSIEPREPVYGVGLSRFERPGRFVGLGAEQIEGARRLWEGMRELNAELETIGPSLLSGLPLPLAKCEDEKVQVHAVLSAEGKVVLFALNTDFEYAPDKFVPHPKRNVRLLVRLPGWLGPTKVEEVRGKEKRPLRWRRKGEELEILLDRLRDACAILVE